MARAVSSLHDPVSVAALACATAVWAARHLDGRVSWHATSQHAAELATVFVGAFKDCAFTADRVRPLDTYMVALRPLLEDRAIPPHDRLVAYAVFNAVAGLNLLARFRPTEANHAACLTLAYAREIATMSQRDWAELAQLFSRYGVSLPPLADADGGGSLEASANRVSSGPSRA